MESVGYWVPQDPEKSWAQQMEGKEDGAFVPYSLATRFAKGQLVTHPKFGKGIVVHVEGARIEVRGEVPTAKVLRLVELAHQECYVANSLRTADHILARAKAGDL